MSGSSFSSTPSISSDFVQFMHSVARLDTSKIHLNSAGSPQASSSSSDSNSTVTLANDFLTSGFRHIFISCVQNDDAANVKSLLKINEEALLSDKLPWRQWSIYGPEHQGNNRYDQFEKISPLRLAIHYKALNALKIIMEDSNINVLMNVLNTLSPSPQSTLYPYIWRKTLQFLSRSDNSVIQFLLQLPRIAEIAALTLPIAQDLKKDIHELRELVHNSSMNDQEFPKTNDFELNQQREELSRLNFKRGMRQIFWAHIITNNERSTRAMLERCPFLLDTRVTYDSTMYSFRPRNHTSTALTVARFADQTLFKLFLSQSNRQDLINAFHVEADTENQGAIYTTIPNFPTFTSLNWLCQENPLNIEQITLFLERLREASPDSQPIEKAAISNLIFKPFTSQDQVTALSTIAASAPSRRFAMYIQSPELNACVYNVRGLVHNIAGYAAGCEDLFPHDAFIRCAIAQNENSDLELYKQALSILQIHGVKRPFDEPHQFELSFLLNAYYAKLRAYEFNSQRDRYNTFAFNVKLVIEELSRQLEMRLENTLERTWTRWDAMQFVRLIRYAKNRPIIELISKLTEIQRIVARLKNRFYSPRKPVNTAAAASSSSRAYPVKSKRVSKPLGIELDDDTAATSRVRPPKRKKRKYR